MQATDIGLHSLSFRQARTYGFALAFVAGNVVLPQLCHLMPQGGLIWLPIYFFTLIAAYKYGIRVGLLTALLSPLVNHLAFGMPPAGMLPVILIKSVTLAVAGALAAGYFRRVTLWGVLAAVAAYQLIGGVAEWIITADLQLALQDFRLGLPGILLQVFGGFAVLKLLSRL